MTHYFPSISQIIDDRISTYWLFHDDSTPLTRRDELSSDMKWDLRTDNALQVSIHTEIRCNQDGKE